ncbi:hypothetical protein BDZ91DRAFT_778881 [Kalaharituber pfeilii]|nr:hypothetical protein BDZ91DRAFT_778881 [Kalaharituber pfeilii]
MPIRRYLRVSKYTVLETRIYLDNPALLNTWLLNSRNPVLPKIIDAIKGLVVMKLREESERVAKGGKKKRGAVKDVFTGDEFEVSVLFLEASTRHTVLSKTRIFRSQRARIKSNASILIDDDEEPEQVRIRAESEEDGTRLQDIPIAPPQEAGDTASEAASIFDDSGEEGERKDTKKPSTTTAYDGFTIYSRVLCLIVKRIDKVSKAGGAAARAEQAAEGGEGSVHIAAGATGAVSMPLPALDKYAERPRVTGPGMMEDWITMTQIARQGGEGNIEGLED